MTHDPTFTDEELAALEIAWNGLPADAASRLVVRLIAALRTSREQVKAVKAVLRAKSGLIDHLQADLKASREEVERLTQQCVTLKSYRHDYPEATAERDALRAEVERLRPLADIGQAVVDNAEPVDEFLAAAERFNQVVTERNEARAEAEQLRAEVAELQGDPAAEYDAASDLRLHCD